MIGNKLTDRVEEAVSEMLGIWIVNIWVAFGWHLGGSLHFAF